MVSSSANERILHLLVETGNREILSHLTKADNPLSVTELAERMVSDETPVLSATTFEAEREQLSLALHHNYLPKLAEVGLVNYDPMTREATRGDLTPANVEWLDGELAEGILSFAHTPGGVDATDIGVVKGRENVLERGRELADEATEELFLMCVSEDMLEDKCLRHAEDAFDRGVDICLGSRNPEVRDLVRRKLPELTMWEPQLDWLNAPSNYPKVGRLVLVDREKVMLGVLDESELQGAATETAVTGEGTSNPLVVLVRDLLGSRLDHLDFQSADFRSEQPDKP